MSEPKDCYVDWNTFDPKIGTARVIHKADCIEVRPHEHDADCSRYHQP